ncbi:Aste57867_2438 [Aphanomyces stellatus]|uniref:Aste57867_2438 protein n=2 Tax=Aphanomyces stellatus TaxID=120398 RepID=A0A485KBU5_9STRA|nr:hypothetical protein As57867_002432 [Aphanomyces stellatus]VFT79639.1 Aste57867_2438 [Aphanomyces stellatus]
MPQPEANLTKQERIDVSHQLLVLVSRDGKLPHGSFKRLAQRFNCSWLTISRIWKRANFCPESNTLLQDIGSRIKAASGRKKKYTDLAQRIAAIPKTDRTTLKRIASIVNMPATSLHRYFKQGLLVRHSSHLKPLLTDANKAARLKWAQKFVGPDLVFDDMMSYVHIDEKWFYMTRVKRTLYLLPGEEPPHRTTQSKRFITKVMFLSAVARPRWNYNKDEWFDGKIGTWHFTEVVPAQRNSRNRPSGTLVTVPVNVSRDTYRDMLVNNVIPAIKNKWPDARTSCIVIQQDNARPHVTTTDKGVLAACKADGWDIAMECQPPNSPDLNVLDLGFFRAIQSLQERTRCRTIDELIAATLSAWVSVDASTLNANFLTLQSCMVETIRSGGNNNYKVPHMKKAPMMKQGRLPDAIECPRDVFDHGLALMGNESFDARVALLSAEVAMNMELAKVSSALEHLCVDHADDDAIDDEVGWTDSADSFDIIV